MSIEANILTQVETQLNLISVANGYNLNVQVVESPDEAINPTQLDAQSMLPAILIFYSASGAMESGYTDSARLGRTNTTLSLALRGVVKDDGASNTKSALTGSMLEDIIKSVGDNIRANVSGVYETEFVGRREPEDFRGTVFSIIEILLDVHYDFETREIVTPIPAALSVPTDLSFAIAGGELNITYTMPSGAAHVNIYKNGDLVKATFTGASWFDPLWHVRGIDNLYELVFVSGAGATVSTGVLGFPYYPNQTPEHLYYQPTWLLATKKLAQMVLGVTTPEMLIENEVRRLIELQRIDTGTLTDVAYTVAGPMTQPLTQAKFPLVHIESAQTGRPTFGGAKGSYQTAYNISAYTLADTSKNARIENKFKANRILHNVREILIENYTLNGKANTSNTIINQSTHSQNPTRLGNWMTFSATLNISVNWDWAWRD